MSATYPVADDRQARDNVGVTGYLVGASIPKNESVVFSRTTPLNSEVLEPMESIVF